MKAYSKLVAMLSSEFQKHLMKHPEIEDQIPFNALIIFQIAGENAFNKWSEAVTLRSREENQPVITITIQRWRDTPSLESVQVKEFVA